MRLPSWLWLLLVGWLATAVAHHAWRLFSVIGFSGVSMLIHGGHAVARACLLLVVGVMTHLALQTFLNIAVVSGFVPTTGISLPFFSYGGTALCLQLVEMGIVLSVSRQIPAPKAG